MSIMILFDVVKMYVYSYDFQCQNSVTVSIIHMLNSIIQKKMVENVFKCIL